MRHENPLQYTLLSGNKHVIEALFKDRRQYWIFYVSHLDRYHFSIQAPTLMIALKFISSPFSHHSLTQFRSLINQIVITMIIHLKPIARLITHAEIQITFHFDQFRQLNLNYSCIIWWFWVCRARDKTFSSSEVWNCPNETERELAASSRLKTRFSTIFQHFPCGRLRRRGNFPKIFLAALERGETIKKQLFANKRTTNRTTLLRVVLRGFVFASTASFSHSPCWVSCTFYTCFML